MIVVFDSGIWISGIQFGGTPAAALRRSMEFDCLAFCAQIESEILEILDRKFGVDSQVVMNQIEPFLRDALRIEITGDVTGVCRDPDDDCILECALKAGAQFIVTGDHDLLVLGEYRGCRIVTAREYLEMWTKP